MFIKKHMTSEEKRKRELFLKRYTHIPYSEEERIQMFVEGKCRVPLPHKNKKRYNRKSLKKFSNECEG